MKTQHNMMETLKINLSIGIGHTWFFFSALLWKPVRHDRLSTSVQRQSKNGGNGRGLPQKQLWALSPQKIEIRPNIWNALLLRRSFVIGICHILNIKIFEIVIIKNTFLIKSGYILVLGSGRLVHYMKESFEEYIFRRLFIVFLWYKILSFSV